MLLSMIIFACFVELNKIDSGELWITSYANSYVVTHPGVGLLLHHVVLFVIYCFVGQQSKIVGLFCVVQFPRTPPQTFRSLCLLNSSCKKHYWREALPTWSTDFVVQITINEIYLCKY